MKTVSLELAKQLKEAGYPQQSVYWHSPYVDHNDVLRYMCEIGQVRKSRMLLQPFYKDVEYYASPSAQEIADQMKYVMGFPFPSWSKDQQVWFYKNFGKLGGDDKAWLGDVVDENVSDCMAKEYLYLVKEGVMSQKQQFTKSLKKEKTG